MKTPYAIALVVVSVLITVAIEESRIATLRNAAQPAASPATAKSMAANATPATAGSAEEPTPPVRTKSRPELKPEPAAKAQDPGDDNESLAKTVRKMWENPAGKAMMNQGVKLAVAMMYEDFISGLDLSKEETDYFKNLLGKEIAGQQEIGMKLMSASPEERQKLVEEMGQRSKDTEGEIRKFLNNDEDFQKYTDYKNRLPEHQQLDAIRAVMTEKGAPIDQETEAKLVDAMYKARTTTGAPDLQGPKAMEAIAAGNLVETFEKNWDKQQEVLRQETSTFLSEDQMAALQEHQNQMKQMQLMGIKMAEKMMPGKKDEGK